MAPHRTDRTGKKLNLKAVAEILVEEGLDPTRELVRIIKKEGALDPEVRARLLTTLMEYVHPKKKSVEITGAEGGPIVLEHVSDALLLKIATQGEVIDADAEEVTDVEVK